MCIRDRTNIDVCQKSDKLFTIDNFIERYQNKFLGNNIPFLTYSYFEYNYDPAFVLSIGGSLSTTSVLEFHLVIEEMDYFCLCDLII